MNLAKKTMSLILVLVGASLFMGSRWARTYGGPNTDIPYSIDRTADGGFVIAGTDSCNIVPPTAPTLFQRALT